MIIKPRCEILLQSKADQTKNLVQQNDDLNQIIKSTSPATIKKFINSVYPNRNNLKPFFNQKFLAHHLKASWRFVNSHHIQFAITAQLDTDIFALIQEIEYYGFETHYIALFFDDINRVVIAKLHLLFPGQHA